MSFGKAPTPSRGGPDHNPCGEVSLGVPEECKLDGSYPTYNFFSSESAIMSFDVMALQGAISDHPEIETLLVGISTHPKDEFLEVLFASPLPPEEEAVLHSILGVHIPLFGEPGIRPPLFFLSHLADPHEFWKTVAEGLNAQAFRETRGVYGPGSYQQVKVCDVG